jgi:hypothetical protein
MSTGNPFTSSSSSDEEACDGPAPRNVFDRPGDCGGNATILQFQYQIQTTLSVAQLPSALPSLEDAMMDVLRPSFGNCSTDAFSAAPADALLPGLAGVTCHSRLMQPANRCLVLGGALTVPERAPGRAQALLRQAMGQGRLNDVHVQIPDVIYLADAAFVETASLEHNIPDDPVAPGNPVWAGVLWPIGSVLLVVAFVGHHRYGRHKSGARRAGQRLGSFPRGRRRMEETTDRWDDALGGTDYHADILWNPPPSYTTTTEDAVFPNIFYHVDETDEELYHNSIASSSSGHSSRSGGGVAGSGRFPVAAAAAWV